MKKPTKTLALAVFAAFGLSLIPASSEAQGFPFYGQNPFSFMGLGGSKYHDELGKKVFMIDSLADQAAFKFAWEVRSKSGSQSTATLLKYLKRHGELTDALVKAYKGKDAGAFAKAASAVQSNMSSIQSARNGVKVSDSVTSLIEKSVPMVSYVHQNSSQFRPYPDS